MSNGGRAIPKIMAPKAKINPEKNRSLGAIILGMPSPRALPYT
jgi:hypothetical protein